MASWFLRILLVALPLLCLFGILSYDLSPIHDRLAWYMANLRVQVNCTLDSLSRWSLSRRSRSMLSSRLRYKPTIIQDGIT